MKKVLLSLVIMAAVSYTAVAQTDLAADQNPNYERSLVKYLSMSDSLNKWHSTTQHEMYKAIDWLADRKEARADRREFRRQLRLERAQWGYQNDYPYNRYYNGNYNRYRYYPYRRNGSFGVMPYYRLNFWWR